MDSKRAARRRVLKQGAPLIELAVGTRSAGGQTSRSVRPAGTDRDPMLYGQRSRYVETAPIQLVNKVNMKMAAGTPTDGECERPLRRGAALVRLILETFVFVVLL